MHQIYRKKENRWQKCQPAFCFKRHKAPSVSCIISSHKAQGTQPAMTFAIASGFYDFDDLVRLATLSLASVFDIFLKTSKCDQLTGTRRSFAWIVFSPRRNDHSCQICYLSIARSFCHPPDKTTHLQSGKTNETKCILQEIGSLGAVVSQVLSLF